MKYRIKEYKGRFYPQKKGWFFWSTIREYLGGDVWLKKSFYSITDCKGYIHKCIGCDEENKRINLLTTKYHYDL